MLTFETIFNKVTEVLQPKSAAAAPARQDDEDDGVPADVDTILASTEKLLAVNRGLAEPDERDSLEFRRIYTPDRLFSERVKLDADKIRRQTMRRLGKVRNLNPIGVAHFDPYMTGLIIGNPLSTPLEEINPLHLVEQARRITALGPGGLPSTDSITEEAQNIHPSTFGFISAIEGPESEKIGIDTRLAWGAKLGNDGRIYQRFKNRRTGKHQWISASDLSDKTVGLPD